MFYSPCLFTIINLFIFIIGPDICGPGTKKVHVIFNYKDKNHLVKKDIRCKDDVYTHLYTLIVKPDNTYEVLIDNEKAESGSLEEDCDMLPAKKIKVRECDSISPIFYYTLSYNCIEPNVILFYLIDFRTPKQRNPKTG